MSNIGYAALSGLQAAQRGIDTVAHNIANSETPGYHRVDAIMREMGPFPVVAGVQADIRRAENQLLDDMMNTAALNKQLADMFNAAVGQLDTLPFDTVSQTYSEMMDSTHQLLRTPNDPVAQQNFNDKVTAFQNSLNRYEEQLSSVKNNMTLRLGYENDKLNQLQTQLQDLVRSGTASPDDINFVKQQIMQAAGTVEAYRQILSSIIPPVELLTLMQETLYMKG